MIGGQSEDSSMGEIDNGEGSPTSKRPSLLRRRNSASLPILSQMDSPRQTPAMLKAALRAPTRAVQKARETSRGSPRGRARKVWDIDPDPDSPLPLRYKGVTQHKNNKRYEAHIWDKNLERKTPGKGGRMKGRQVYLGSYSDAVDAAKAHDQASIAFFCGEADLNFPGEYDSARIELLRATPREDLVNVIKQSANGYTRSPGSQKKGAQKAKSRATSSGSSKDVSVSSRDDDSEMFTSPCKEASEGRSGMRPLQALHSPSTGQLVELHLGDLPTIGGEDSDHTSFPEPSAFETGLLNKERGLLLPSQRPVRFSGLPSVLAVEWQPQAGAAGLASKPFPMSNPYASFIMSPQERHPELDFDQARLMRTETFDQDLLNDMVSLLYCLI